MLAGDGRLRQPNIGWARPPSPAETARDRRTSAGRGRRAPLRSTGSACRVRRKERALPGKWCTRSPTDVLPSSSRIMMRGGVVASFRERFAVSEGREAGESLPSETSERGIEVRSAMREAPIHGLIFHFAATKVRPKMQRIPLSDGAPVQRCQWRSMALHPLGRGAPVQCSSWVLLRSRAEPPFRIRTRGVRNPVWSFFSRKLQAKTTFSKSPLRLLKF